MHYRHSDCIRHNIYNTQYFPCKTSYHHGHVLTCSYPGIKFESIWANESELLPLTYPITSLETGQTLSSLCLWYYWTLSQWNGCIGTNQPIAIKEIDNLLPKYPNLEGYNLPDLRRDKMQNHLQWQDLCKYICSCHFCIRSFSKRREAQMMKSILLVWALLSLLLGNLKPTSKSFKLLHPWFMFLSWSVISMGII